MWEEMEVASFEESLIGTGFAVEFAAAFLLDSKMSKKGFSHKPMHCNGVGWVGNMLCVKGK